MLWMVKPEIAQRYERACREGIQPSAAQLERFTAARSRSSSHEGPVCLTIAGDVAQIEVDGVLTPQPDWLCWYLFGNTAYSEIREAVAAAETNPAVKRIQWAFSSPGGMVDGFFDLLPFIENITKPSEVLASMACSAAYGLAVNAGKIKATSPASEFGSVGCVRTYVVDGPAAEELSIDVTSTEAPNKRPDVRTPEGLAVVKRELDVQHDLLADAIARGRSRATGTKITKALVNAEFGRGGSVYAEEAAEKGMIDKAPPRKPRQTQAVATPSATPSAPQRSIRSDAAMMAELFGSKRAEESEDAYVARFVAFAESLTPGGATRSPKPAASGPDYGDRMADLMGLPPDPNPGAPTDAELRQQDEELGRSFMAMAFANRDAVTARRATEDAPKTADAGDRMADLIGLPPDPKNARVTAAVNELVAALGGASQPAACTDSRPAPPVRLAVAEGKDLGDVMADLMGLPPDPGPRNNLPSSDDGGPAAA